MLRKRTTEEVISIVFKDFKYVFECDQCGWIAVYHAGGRRKKEAVKAVGYKKINGKWLCENCQKEEKK